MAEYSTRCGIDVLEKQRFEPLRGRRIGLITNHTGLNREGIATVDILRAAPDCHLVALFGPEHGIRGALDEPVADSRDSKTGLPVYSLYGTRNRPAPEQLDGIDTLVYDIQDVGARFYTFISTLGLCMEAAAEKGIRFVVLDRPNPIGGVGIEGPIADSDRLDFVAYHPLPVRHGLTVGELARLFADEKHLKLDLKVIPVEGWKRSQLWDSTGLTWVNPSPNMRSLSEALLYPGIGLLEFTNISVGRGTDTPFERIGAPWMHRLELAAALNEKGLPGIRFVPIRFTPASSVHAKTECDGVNLIVTERSRFIPVLTGISIAETLRRLYPQDWTAQKMSRLLVNQHAMEALLSGAHAEMLVSSWQPEIEAFRHRRQPYLLYK